MLPQKKNETYNASKVHNNLNVVFCVTNIALSLFISPATIVIWSYNIGLLCCYLGLL